MVSQCVFRLRFPSPSGFIGALTMMQRKNIVKQSGNKDVLVPTCALDITFDDRTRVTDSGN